MTINEVLRRLPDARRSGKGWKARCPAHDDRRASLSISQGDDGRALVYCHAGCSTETVCSAIGLRVLDLMPDSSPSVNGQHNHMKRTSRVYETMNAAVAALEAKHGPRSAMWIYSDTGGTALGAVVRWNHCDRRKDIRPIARHNDGWRIAGMQEPRPLYRLPELAAAEQVLVCEGEKAADAARSIGLIATTSPHGAQSAEKADWRPLAGKEVVILPDNDSAGRDYADKVASLLAELSPPPIVKIVELSDLPDGGDIVDWIDAQGDAAEPDVLRESVASLVVAAEQIEARPRTLASEPYVTFPVDSLPEHIRSFVVDGAKAIGCDPSYIALPLLSSLAAAIGNSRRIQLKQGWTAPANVWTAIVGESGTAKSPAFRLTMRPVMERQRRAFARHQEELKVYDAAVLQYEKELKEWKSTKHSAGDPPEKPTEPVAERFVVQDTTVEALAPLLLANPRGLLLSRDELAGWIGSFDRYTGGRGGADAAHWLSIHNGDAIVVDRKTGKDRTIFVPAACVCVCGGIQPGVLNRALGVEHRESGLAARLLLSYPPRIAKSWTEADVAPEAESRMARLLDRLYELQPSVLDDGTPQPVVIGLTPDAKAAWTGYYDEHAREQASLAGDLAAAWSKLEEYAARLALVVHLSQWAAGADAPPIVDAVDVDAMRSGIALANWFKGETRRVYGMLHRTDDDRERDRLIEWISGRGGSTTSREVQMGCRWLRESGAAQEALDDLARDGHGRWEVSAKNPKGGPSPRVFRLSTPSTVNITPTSAGHRQGLVDVDAVDAPRIKEAGESWGEV